MPRPKRLPLLISIHALRVEGDSIQEQNFRKSNISIHALRVEGDDIPKANKANGNRISIHALRVEGDHAVRFKHSHLVYFYPRPPGGGRRVRRLISSNLLHHFYPRPPGGGRQQKRTKFSSVFAKKGEEFASLRRGKRKICRWRFKKDKFWVLIWCEGSRKSVCALASHCG